MQSSKYKCLSLSYAVTTILRQNFWWINTITLDEDHTISDEIIDISFDLSSSHRNMSINCQKVCTIFSNLTVIIRQFHLQLNVIFHNLIFQNLHIRIQNVIIMFFDVQFVNCSISDIPQRLGEFGEIMLFFFNVSFKSWSNCSLDNVVFHNTFKMFTLIENSDMHKLKYRVNGSYCWLIVRQTSFQDSFIDVYPSRLSRVEILTSYFDSQHFCEKQSSVIKLQTEKLTLIMVNSAIQNSQGAVAVQKKKSFFLSWLQILIQTCSFNHNHKLNSGAALDVHFAESMGQLTLNYLKIEMSKFVGNVVKRKDYHMSYGGAIYLESTSTKSTKEQGTFLVTISNSSFDNNKAEDGGGAMYISGGEVAVKLLGCHFSFSYQTVQTKVPFILGFSKISVFESKFICFTDTPFIELQMTSANTDISVLQLHIMCLPWQKLDVGSGFGVSLSGQNILQKFVLRCLSCPVSYYVPSDGIFTLEYLSCQTSVSVSLENVDNTEQKCVACPPGATCPGNGLQAKSNFWGYKSGNTFVFEQCPSDHCCSQESNVPCKSYNQCAKNRLGTLCGQCEKNYSLSMMSTTCMKNEDCNKWYFTAFVLAALLYMLWYTFKEYTYQIPMRVGHHLFKILIGFERDNKCDGRNDTEKGFFDIMIFYVQTVVVLRLSLPSPESTALRAVRSVETYIGLFLCVELSTLATDICITEHSTMTEKVMWKAAFMVGIFISWCVFYFCHLLVKFCLTQKFGWKDSSFSATHDTLFDGLMKIINYTYAGFSQILFFSLTCVSISGTEVWLYDGSVQCLSQWQTVMIACGLLFVVPFPLTLGLGMSLLQKGLVSWNYFTLGLCFQYPFLIYGVLLATKWETKVMNFEGNLNVNKEAVNRTVKRIAWKWKRQTPTRQTPKSNVSHEVTALSEEMKMFNRFKGGYRQEGMATYWECVRMFRRLLISSTSLFPNSIVKEFICCVFCILFLIHHVGVKPFVHSLSNKAETLSLTFLCGVALTNCVKAVYIQEGISPVGVSEQIVQCLSFAETMFLPLLLLFIVAGEAISTCKGCKGEIGRQFRTDTQ